MPAAETDWITAVVSLFPGVDGRNTMWQADSLQGQKYFSPRSVLIGDIAIFVVVISLYKEMTRVLTITVIALLIPLTLYPQNRRVQRAYDAWESGEYYEAVDLFRSAYSRTRDRDLRSELVFMIAESYRRINDARNAESWYRRATRVQGARPDAFFWLAESMRKNGKYEEAIEEYRRYRELVPGDPRADVGIRSCELAMQWIENPEAYLVEEIRELSSRASDFSPVFVREDNSMLYFTSSRDEATGRSQHGATGEGFTDIFETRLDMKGSWSTPVPVTGINSDAEEGTPSVSYDYREMFFTRCEMVRRETRGCAIMYSVRSGAGWAAPVNLNLVPDTLVAAHPAISPDGLTLYFTSNMPGSFGRNDIYYVTREPGSEVWSEPVNLGPDINTSGSEMFPYVRDDGALYFASDGHPGMGGLDIFRADRQPDGSWIVTNMKPPINSPADDFGIVFERGAERGIFSSSRKGRGNDVLYSFEMPPLRFTITGLVRNEKEGTPLEGSTVQLIASDGATREIVTGESGEFEFSLRPDVDYIFLATKQGFLNGRARETTRGHDRSHDFLATIDLTPIDRPIELPNIFYDFARWDLRPESMVSLDRLVETLNDNPTITIELMSHTDSRDTEEFNLLLSQRRAQSVVDYLVEQGIEEERLSAVGYGKGRPKEVDEDINETYPFLPVGVILTEDFIDSLPDDEKREIAHQINRRTEFRVLSTDYRPDDRRDRER